MKVNNSLQELDIWYNEIGDDGILVVVDGLQCNNTLTKLDVGRCGLSVKGTVVYKTEFNTIWLLQFLFKFSVFSQTKDLDQTDNTILFY